MKLIFSISFLFFMGISFGKSAKEIPSCIVSTEDTTDLSTCLFHKRLASSENVLSQKTSWKKNEGKYIHLDYTSDVDWLKFKLINDSSKTIQKFLIVNSVNTGDISLFSKNENKLTLLDKFGFYDTTRDTIKSYSKINIKPGVHEYIIKRKGKIRLDGTLVLADKEYLKEKDSTLFYVVIMFLGATGALILFNFAFYFISKEKPHLLYSLFSALMVGMILSFNGVFSFLNWSILGQSIEQNLSIFSVGMALAALSFGKHFLNFNKNWSNKEKYFYNTLCYWLIYLLVHDVIISDYISLELGKVIELSIIVEILFLVYMALKMIKENKLAKFYLASWSFYFAFAFINFLYSIDMGSFEYVQYGLFVACVFELLMFSISLSYKYKLVMIQKTQAQMEAREKKKYQSKLKILSHDVSNPLAAAMMGLEFLGKMPKAEERISNGLNRINEILENARNVEKDSEELKGNTLAKNAFSSLKSDFKDKLKAKKLKFIFKGDSDILIPAKCNVLKDNLLANLLSNAIKFTPEGGEIILKVEQEDNNVIVSLKDNGNGMSQDVLEKLNSGETVTTEGTNCEKGTGFGTQIVRDLMEDYQGELCIYSEEEKGSEFTLIFPLS